MHICILSTYPPARCGVGTYAAALAQALHKKDQRVTIVAEMDKIPSTTPGPIPVYRTWNRYTPDGQYSLRNFVREYHKAGSDRPDLIHVQHEFGVFPDHDVVIDILNQTPSCITLHTVEPQQHHFNSRLGPNVITHTIEAQAIVNSWGIPHGTTIHNARPTKQFFLCPGFISLAKGTIEVVEGYNHALAQGDLPNLIIAGMCRDVNYENDIRNKITYYGLGRKVELRLSYQEDTHSLYSNAIAVVLGSNPKPEATHPYSASGQLATAVGYGLPVLARPTPIYRSQPGAGILYYNNAQDLGRLFHAVRRKDVWRGLHEMSKSAAISWDDVADMHLEVYSSLVKGKTNATVVPKSSGTSPSSVGVGG